MEGRGFPRDKRLLLGTFICCFQISDSFMGNDCQDLSEKGRCMGAFSFLQPCICLLFIAGAIDQYAILLSFSLRVGALILTLSFQTLVMVYSLVIWSTMFCIQGTQELASLHSLKNLCCYGENTGKRVTENNNTEYSNDLSNRQIIEFQSLGPIPDFSIFHSGWMSKYFYFMSTHWPREGHGEPSDARLLEVHSIRQRF